VSAEPGYVTEPFPKRRGKDGYGVESVIEVLSEDAFFYGFGEIAVGGCDDSDINRVYF
jgi:hypothetical protein